MGRPSHQARMAARLEPRLALPLLWPVFTVTSCHVRNAWAEEGTPYPDASLPELDFLHLMIKNRVSAHHMDS